MKNTYGQPVKERYKPFNYSMLCDIFPIVQCIKSVQIATISMRGR